MQLFWKLLNVKPVHSTFLLYEIIKLRHKCQPLSRCEPGAAEANISKHHHKANPTWTLLWPAMTSIENAGPGKCNGCIQLLCGLSSLLMPHDWISDFSGLAQEMGRIRRNMHQYAHLYAIVLLQVLGGRRSSAPLFNKHAAWWSSARQPRSCIPWIQWNGNLARVPASWWGTIPFTHLPSQANLWIPIAS